MNITFTLWKKPTIPLNGRSHSLRHREWLELDLGVHTACSSS